MFISPNTAGLCPKLGETGHNWSFWELKDSNVHRGIIDCKVLSQIDVVAIEDSIRANVRKIYQPSWVRGFAFGATVQFEVSPNFQLQEFYNCIDSYNKSKGVFQWVIAVDHQKKHVYAVHMWAHGLLHERFIKTIDQLENLGFTVEKIYKDQPGFFNRIEAFIRFPQARKYSQSIEANESITHLSDNASDESLAQQRNNGLQNRPYVPNQISVGTRMWNIVLSCFLIGYGGVGIALGGILIPGKRSAVIFHGIPMWFVFGAILLSVANLLSVVLDHYDQRENERYYKLWAKYTQVVSWFLFASAFFLEIIVFRSGAWVK